MAVPGRLVLTGAMTQTANLVAQAVAVTTPAPDDGTLVHLIEETPRSAASLDYLRAQPFPDALVLVPGNLDRWASGGQPLPDDPAGLGGLADLYRLQVQVPVGEARAPQLVPVDVRGRETSWDDATSVRVLPWSHVAGRAGLQSAYGRIRAGEKPGRQRVDALLADLAEIQLALRDTIPPGSLAAAVHLARAGNEADAETLARKVLPVAASDLPDLVGGTAEPIAADVLLDALRDTPDSAALVSFLAPSGGPTVAWLLPDGEDVLWIGSPESDGAPIVTRLTDDWRMVALRDATTTALLVGVDGRPVSVDDDTPTAPAVSAEVPGAWADHPPVVGQRSAEVDARLAEMRRVLIETGTELRELRSAPSAVDRGRDAEEPTASAGTADVAAREWEIAAEVDRQRTRIAELTKITEHEPIEETPDGVPHSHVWVRQAVEGRTGYVRIPVVVDEAGVHSIHPDTGEITGDLRLVNGEWTPRVLGGAPGSSSARRGGSGSLSARRSGSGSSSVGTAASGSAPNAPIIVVPPGLTEKQLRREWPDWYSKSQRPGWETETLWASVPIPPELAFTTGLQQRVTQDGDPGGIQPVFDGTAGMANGLVAFGVDRLHRMPADGEMVYAVLARGGIDVWGSRATAAASPMTAPDILGQFPGSTVIAGWLVSVDPDTGETILSQGAVNPHFSARRKGEYFPGVTPPGLADLDGALAAMLVDLAMGRGTTLVRGGAEWKPSKVAEDYELLQAVSPAYWTELRRRAREEYESLGARRGQTRAWQSRSDLLFEYLGSGTRYGIPPAFTEVRDLSDETYVAAFQGASWSVQVGRPDPVDEKVADFAHEGVHAEQWVLMGRLVAGASNDPDAMHLITANDHVRNVLWAQPLPHDDPRYPLALRMWWLRHSSLDEDIKGMAHHAEGLAIRNADQVLKVRQIEQFGPPVRHLLEARMMRRSARSSVLNTMMVRLGLEGPAYRASLEFRAGGSVRDWREVSAASVPSLSRYQAKSSAAGTHLWRSRERQDHSARLVHHSRPIVVLELGRAEDAPSRLAGIVHRLPANALVEVVTSDPLTPTEAVGLASTVGAGQMLAVSFPTGFQIDPADPLFDHFVPYSRWHTQSMSLFADYFTVHTKPQWPMFDLGVGGVRLVNLGGGVFQRINQTDWRIRPVWQTLWVHAADESPTALPSSVESDRGMPRIVVGAPDRDTPWEIAQLGLLLAERLMAIPDSRVDPDLVQIHRPVLEPPELTDLPPDETAEPWTRQLLISAFGEDAVQDSQLEHTSGVDDFDIDPFMLTAALVGAVESAPEGLSEFQLVEVLNGLTNTLGITREELLPVGFATAYAFGIGHVTVPRLAVVTRALLALTGYRPELDFGDDYQSGAPGVTGEPIMSWLITDFRRLVPQDNERRAKQELARLLEWLAHPDTTWPSDGLTSEYVQQVLGQDRRWVDHALSRRTRDGSGVWWLGPVAQRHLVAPVEGTLVLAYEADADLFPVGLPIPGGAALMVRVGQLLRRQLPEQERDTPVLLVPVTSVPVESHRLRSYLTDFENRLAFGVTMAEPVVLVPADDLDAALAQVSLDETTSTVGQPYGWRAPDGSMVPDYPPEWTGSPVDPVEEPVSIGATSQESRPAPIAPLPAPGRTNGVEDELVVTRAQARLVSWAVPDRLVELRRLADEGRPGAGEALADLETYREVLAGTTAPDQRQPDSARRDVAAVASAYRVVHDRLTALASALDLPHLAPPGPPSVAADDGTVPVDAVPVPAFPVELVPPRSEKAPVIADLVADPATRTWLTSNTIPPRQVARLVTGGRLRFDPGQVDQVVRMLGEGGDARKLVDLVEVLGTVPLDLRERSEAAGLAGPGPLFGVVRELAVSPADAAALGDVLARVADGSSKVGPDEGTWVDRLRPALADAGVRTNSDLVWLMRLTRRMDLAPTDRRWLGELRDVGVPLELLHEMPDEYVRAALDGRRRADTGLTELAADTGLGGPAALQAAAERLGVPPVDLALALGDRLRAAVSDAPPLSDAGPDGLREQGQQAADRLLAQVESTGPGLDRWVRWSARLGFPVDRLRPLAEIPMLEGLIWEALGDVPGGRVAEVLLPLVPEAAAPAPIAPEHTAVPTPDEVAAWSERLGVPDYYLRRVLVMPGVDGRALPAMADRLALPPAQAAALVRLVEVTGRVSADDLLMFAHRLGVSEAPYLLVWLASYWEIHPRRLMPLRPLFARITEMPTQGRPSMQQIEELVGRWADPGRAGAEYHAEPAADLTDGLLLDRHDNFDNDDQFQMWPTAEETAASVRGPRADTRTATDSDDDSDRSSSSESLLSILDDDEQQAQHTSLAALVYSGRSTWTRADGAGRSRRNASALFWAAGLGSGPEGAGLEVLDRLRTFVPTAVRDRRDRLRRWAEISFVEAEELWQDTEKVAADPDLGTLTRQATIVASAATAAVPALTRDITSPDVAEVVRGAVQATDAVVDAVRAWTERHLDRPIPSAGDGRARPVRVPDLVRALSPSGVRTPVSAGRDDLAAMLTGVRALLHALTRTTEVGHVYRTAAMVIEVAATHIARLVVGAGTTAAPGAALIANAVAAQAVEAAARLAATVAAWDRLAGGLSAAELAAAVSDGQAEARSRTETDERSADIVLAPTWATLIDVPEREIEEDRYLRPWLDHLAVLQMAGRIQVPPTVLYEYTRRNEYLSERTPELLGTWNLGRTTKDIYRLANEESVPVRLLSPLRTLLNARTRTTDPRQVKRSLERIELPDRIAKSPRRRLAFLTDVDVRTTALAELSPGQLDGWALRWEADILGMDPEDLDGADGVSLRSLLDLVDLVRREFAAREPEGHWARHDIESLADALGLSRYLVTGHSVRVGRVPVELATKRDGGYLFLLANALRMDSREVPKPVRTQLTEMMERSLPRQVVVDRTIARIRAKGQNLAPGESLTGKLLRIGMASNDVVPRHLGLLAQQAGVSATDLVEMAYQAGEVDLWLTADSIGLTAGSRPAPQDRPEAEEPARTGDLAVLPRMVREWVDWLGGIAWASGRLHPALTAQARRAGWAFDELSALPGDERAKVLEALAVSASEAGLIGDYHNTVSRHGHDIEHLLQALTGFVDEVVGARLELPMPQWAEFDSAVRVNVRVPQPVDADFAAFAGFETRREWFLTDDPDTWKEMEEGLRALQRDGARVGAATVSGSEFYEPVARVAELDLTPLAVSALLAVIFLPGGPATRTELLGYLGYEVDPYDSTRLDRRVSRPEPMRVDPFRSIGHPPTAAVVMAAAIARLRQPGSLVAAARPSTTLTWFLDDEDPAPVGADEHHLVPNDVGDAPGSLVRAVLDGARAQGLRLPSQVRDEDDLIRHVRQVVQDDPSRFPLRTIGELVAEDLDDRALLGLAEALPVTSTRPLDSAVLRRRISQLVNERDPRLRRLLGTAVAVPGSGAAWMLRRVGGNGTTGASHIAHLLPEAIGDPALWDSALIDEVIGAIAVALGVDLVVVEDEVARRFSGGRHSTLHLLRVERDLFRAYHPAPVPAQLTAIEPAHVIFGEYDAATDSTRLPLVVTGLDGRRLSDLTADLTGQELIDRWAVQSAGESPPLLLVMGGAADESGPHGALARRFRDRFATPVIASTVDIILGADGKVSAASVVYAPNQTVDRTRTEPGEFRYFPPDGGRSEPLGDDLAVGGDSLGLRIVVNLPLPDVGATVLAARPGRPTAEEAPVPHRFVAADAVTPAESTGTGRIRIGEMQRAMVDRARALRDLNADHAALQYELDSGELTPTAAAAQMAELSDKILHAQTELHRLRERVAELSEIVRHQPVEATPEGLTSHIRVEQSVSGADRWLLVPVLIDDTGVHGRHPETGELTADYYLTTSRQWLPRLRGGAPGAIRDASVEAPTASRTGTAPAGTGASQAAPGVVADAGPLPPRGAADAASPSTSDLPDALAVTEAQVRFVAWAVPDRLAALRRLAAEEHPGAGAASAAVDAYLRVLFGAADGRARRVSEADRTTSYRRMHERLAALDLPYLAPPTTDPSGADDAVVSLPAVPEADFPVVLVAPESGSGPFGRATDTEAARWLRGAGVTGPQAARLLDDGELPFDRTEVDRLAQRLDMAGDDVAELVNLVEVLGTVPLDVGTHAREIGLAGPGPLFGVVRDLGVPPELVVTVGDVLARVAAGSREIEPDEGSWVDLLRTELAGEGVRTDSDLVWLMRLIRRSSLSPADRSALGELRELGVPLELLYELPTAHVRAALTGRSRAAGSLATLATESGLAGPAALEAAAERFGVPPVDLALALGDQLRAAAASVPVDSPDDPAQLRRQGHRVAESVSALLPADADVVRWVRWTARLGFPVEHLRLLVDSPAIAESVWAALGDVPSERVADVLVPVAPETAATAALTRALARKRNVPAPDPPDLARWAERLGVPVAYLRRVTALPGVDGARLSELVDRLGLSTTQAPALVRLVEVTGRVPVELLWIAYRLDMMQSPYLLVWLAATWETDPRGLLSLRPLFDRIRELPSEVRPTPGQIEELVTRWAALGRPGPRGDGEGDAQEWPVRSDASIISEPAADDQRPRYVRELLRFAEGGTGPQGGGLHLADRLRAVHVAELTRNVEQLRRSRDVDVADPTAVWQEVDAVADDPYVGALTRQAAIIVGTARSVTLTLHHPVADPGDVIQAATRAAGALTAAVRWWTEHHADRSIPGVDETTTLAGLVELAAALPGQKSGGRRDAAGQMLAEVRARLEPLSRPGSTWHGYRNADLVIRTAAVHVTRLLVAAGAAASPSASLIMAAVADQVVEAARQLATAMRTWDRLTGGMSATEVSATAEAPLGADDLPPAQFVDNLLAASWATLFAVRQHDIEDDRRERPWLDPERVYSLAVEAQVPPKLVYQQARAQEHLSERTPDQLRVWGLQPPFESVYQSALDLQVPVRLLQPFLRAGGVAAQSDAAWIRGVLGDMAQRAGMVTEEPSRHLAFLADVEFDSHQPVTGRELRSSDRQWTADVLGMDPSDLDRIGTVTFDDLTQVVERVREYHDARTPGGSWGRHEIESLADALGLSYLLVLGHSVRIGRVPVELSDDPYGPSVFLLANRGRVDARELAPIRGEIAVRVDRGGPRHVVLDDLASLLREHVGEVPPRDSLTRRLLGVSDAEKLKLLHLREQYQLAGVPIEDVLTVAELAEVTLDVALEFVMLAAGHRQPGAGDSAAREVAGLASAPLTPEATATRLREWVARLHGIEGFDSDVAEVLWAARDAGWTLEDLSALSVDDAERVLTALGMALKLDVEFRSITVGYSRDVEVMFRRLEELVEYAADSRFDQRNLTWTDVALPGVRIDVDLPGATGAEPESRDWDLERWPDRRSVNTELNRLYGAGTTTVPVSFKTSAGDVVRVAEVDTVGPVFGALAAIHGLPGGPARHPDLLAHLGYEFAPYDHSRLDRRVSAVPPLALASFARVADPSLRAVIMMAVIWRVRQPAPLVPASRVEPLTTRLLDDGEPAVADGWEYHLGARDLGTEPGSLTRAVLDSARAQGLKLPADVRDEATLLQHAGQVVRADPHRFTIRSIGELIIGSLADEAVTLLAGALGLNKPSPGEPSLRTRLVTMADEDTARLYRFLTLLTPDSDAAGALVRAGSPEANPARDAAALLVAAIGAPRMWNSTILDEVAAVFAVALGVDLVVLGDEDARTYPGGGATLFVRRVGGDLFQSYRPTGSWGQPAAFGSSPVLLAEYDPTTDVARVPVVLDGRRHRDVTLRFTGADLIDRWVPQAGDTSAPLVLLVGAAARGDGTGGSLAARFRDRVRQPVIAPLDDIALDPQARVSAVRADRRPDGTVDLHGAQPSEFWYFPADGGTAVPLGGDLVTGAATVGLRLVADLPTTGEVRTALTLRPVPPLGDDVPPPRLFVDGDGAVRLGRLASPPEGWWPLGDASPLLALRWLTAGGPADGIDPSALEQADLQAAAEQATRLHEQQMAMLDVPHRMRSLLAAESPRATTVDDRLPALRRGDGVIFVSASGQAQAATRLRNGDLFTYRPARGDTSTERLSWARFVEEAGEGWFLVQHHAADPAPMVLPTGGPVDPTASRWYDRPENVGAFVVPEIEQAPQSGVVWGDATDGLDVRLNPLWMPLADFTPEVWAGRPGHEWLFLVLERGSFAEAQEGEDPRDLLVFVGSETATGAMSRAQLDDLLTSMRKVDPTVTLADVRDMLDGPGHPSLAARFEGDGTARLTRAGVAGNMRRDPQTGTWALDGLSGRYSSGRLGPLDDLDRWLRDAAGLIADQVREPVAPSVYSRRAKIESRYEFNSKIYYPHPADTLDTYYAVRRMPDFRPGVWSVYATLDPQTGEVVTRNGRYGPRNFTRELARSSARFEGALLLVLFLPGDAEGTAAELQALFRFGERVQEARRTDVTVSVGTAHILPGDGDVRLGTLTADVVGAPMVEPAGAFVRFRQPEPGKESEPKPPPELLDASADASMMALLAIGSPSGVHDSPQRHPVPFGPPRIDAPRGAAYDGGLLVVGDVDRWRQRSVAETVARAARAVRRPVVVVEVGAGVDERSAVLTVLGMTLIKLGERRLQPIVIATAPAAALTALVNRYDLSLVGPETTEADARWQVTGPDGAERWSTSAFVPTLFTTAGQITTGPVARSGSVTLSEWLGQPDWPTAEEYLRENVADLRHPYVVDELAHLRARDPDNRLLSAHEAVLDLVRAANGAIDPAESRYQPTEPIQTFDMEPRTSVQGPMTVTFALDYLEPKPDALSRKPWDDRLLRLMYADGRARELAAALAAGVVGEQRDRVDDGRWNATVFGAVAIVLRMTREEARTPGFVDAWGKALEDVACCEANPTHRMYWVPRLDELRDEVGAHGVPGHVDGPAERHAALLEVLTYTLANC
ncbi:hypothetical protein [Micromonospora craniellae]|nr:hypothetical protein [Micromonospora craniellae]QOC93833.1 hypothetical protein ID554_09500 [Micromonospora craniellae]